MPKESAQIIFTLKYKTVILIKLIFSISGR